MPLYDYKCNSCEAIKLDVPRLVAERHDGPTCDKCYHQMTLQVLQPPKGFVKNPAVSRGR